MNSQTHTLTLLLMVTLSGSASAQLFGPRSVGRNARGTQSTESSTAGTITEDRRFIRGNRSSNNFVGADREEASVFVGNAQATNDGEVMSAVDGLRELPSAQVNRRATNTTRRMYRPRLSVGFLLPKAPSGNGQRSGSSLGDLSPSLQELSVERGFRISHVATERSVTLTGTVATKRDRQIAELLVLFEPCVETVKNDLQVVE